MCTATKNCTNYCQVHSHNKYYMTAIFVHKWRNGLHFDPVGDQLGFIHRIPLVDTNQFFVFKLGLYSVYFYVRGSFLGIIISNWQLGS